MQEVITRQNLNVSEKIRWAKERIKEWYEAWDGQVYVSFSGGKDSTMLLHLVRLLYPEVPGVFVNTGLEFPEVTQFVRTTPNVTWLRPSKSFKEVVDYYGFPVVSKEVAMAISRCRNTKSEVQKGLRLRGGINPSTGRKQTAGVIPQKYHYLLNAPFKISEQCCTVMKKQPLKKYYRETGRVPYVGVMATDSRSRLRSYAEAGCNIFDRQLAMSRPLSIWREEDIWRCLRAGIPYSSIYDKGYDRTGCVFCMFGCQQEADPRFVRLKKTHPRLHEYCMGSLGLREVLNFMNVPTE